MNKAKKILIPRNPDDTISLPPYVDFRDDETPEPDDKLWKSWLITDAIKPCEQEGRE